MNAYRYTVIVEADTAAQAATVMAERCEPNEDYYGFDYTIEYEAEVPEAIVAGVWPASAPELKGRYEGWNERRVELADGDGTGDGFGSDWGESDDEGIELLRDIAAHLWQAKR